MADNTQLNTMTGGDTISTDDLSTLNSAVVSGQKVQRMKVGFGVDGALQDVSVQNPLPVDIPDQNDNLNLASIGKEDVATVAPGVQLVAEADELGTPLGSTSGARDVFVKNQNLSTSQALPVADAVVRGNLSALNQKVDLVVSGYSTGVISLTGTWVATVNFQVSLDGISFNSVTTYNAIDYISGGSAALSATTNSTRVLSIGGVRILRVTPSAFTSGIISVEIRGSVAAPTTQNMVMTGVNAVNNYLPITSTTPADGVSAAGNALSVLGYSLLFNNSNFDRTRSALHAANTTGTGIQAAGMMAELDDTSPTAITENQFGNLRIAADRSLLVSNRSVTPTQTSVAGSASNASLLAANASRKTATIFNDSASIMYLKLGTTASNTSYTTQMQSNDYYEVPSGYIGAIDGIWVSATGNARITEIV